MSLNKYQAFRKLNPIYHDNDLKENIYKQTQDNKYVDDSKTYRIFDSIYAYFFFFNSIYSIMLVFSFVSRS